MQTNKNVYLGKSMSCYLRWCFRETLNVNNTISLFIVITLIRVSFTMSINIVDKLVMNTFNNAINISFIAKLERTHLFLHAR